MNIDKSLRRPVIDPLLLALKSRRVLIALSAVLVSLLTLAIPALQAVHGELLTLVISLALALIGGFSLEDAATAARTRSAAPDDETLRQLIKDVLTELGDEIASPQ